MKYVRCLRSPLTAWLLDRPALRRALAGLVVLGALAWLAVGTQQFTTETSAQGPPVPVVAFYTGPLPYYEMPAEVSPGDKFTFTLTFENTGPDPDDAGYNPYIDLYLPTKGIDGEDEPPTGGGPCDGIWFVEADGLFASPSPDPLYVFPPSGPPAGPSGPPGGPAYRHSIIPISVNPPVHCNNSASAPAIGGVITPLGPHPISGATILSGLPGYELVVIQLPFGSYYPDEGITYVNVTARVSDHADADVPLTLFARGGFQYGGHPSGTVSPVPIEQHDQFGNPDFDQAYTTPEPFTISKVCTLLDGTLCPEDETATGPNFPMNYVITVDIDEDLTIKNLQVVDYLPNNVQYDDNLQVTVLGALASPFPSPPYTCFKPPILTGFPVAISSVPGTSPGGTLEATLCGSVTGTTDPDEVVISFQLYVPALDNGDYPILDDACRHALAINDVKATGDWDPIIDPRDDQPPPTVTSDTTPEDHTLLKKCIAIQKTAAPAVVTPGDTITYTLNFQLSDYLQVKDVALSDFLSDGQHYVDDFATLSVIDKTGSLVLTPPDFSPYVTVTGPPSQDAVCDPDTPWPGGLPKIGTRIDFHVSAALIGEGAPPPTLSLGYLTGGQIPPTGAPGATGTITFQTTVRDKFDCPVPDDWVDKFDRLYDYVTIRGEVIKRADGVLEPFPTTEDDSGAVVPVEGDSIKKCIYSIERPAGNPVLGPPAQGDDCAVQPTDPAPQITPGDVVKFRILKTIPTGDYEKLVIKDFLPHPVMQTGSVTFLPGPPLVNPLCPFASGPATVPSPTFPPGENSVKFDYDTNHDTLNVRCDINILLGVTVTGAPYADGLLFSNAARECEDNSLNERICQTAIAPMVLTEPRLRITKGVVAACQPVPSAGCPATGTFNPMPVGPVAFSLPGSANPRFTPLLINSNGLLTAPINSNANVDGGDIVTFAVVVENYGTGLNGAFDVKINDTTHLPYLIKPAGGYNFSVTDGTGNAFTCIPVCDGSNDVAFATAFFSLGGIELKDPSLTQGALYPYHQTSGQNIAVITYDLQVKPDVTAGGCFDNTATILNYAGIEGGTPSHTVTPYGGPYSDTAKVCIKPTITKSIVATSEAHTAVSGGRQELAIGEIIRYRLNVVVPEGKSPNFQVQDVLPAELLYISGATTTLSVTNTGPTNTGTFGTPLPTMTTELLIGPIQCPGNRLVFFNLDDVGNPGILTNGDQDPDQETIHIEFNALVSNDACNQDAPQALRDKDNYADVLTNGSVVWTSDKVYAKIVEPEVTITKQILSQVTVGSISSVKYKITLESTGTADAFDVRVTDVLPSGCQMVGSPTWTPPPPPALWMAATHPTNPIVTIGHFPKGETQGIEFTANCGSSSDPCDNRAEVKWTSLPGDFGTTSNLTGSATPGVSGAKNGERDGSDGLLNSGVLNDYKASTGTTGCGPCEAGPGELNVSTGTAGIPNPDPIWTLVTPSSPPAYGIQHWVGNWVDPPAGSNWIHGGPAPGSDPQLGSGGFPAPGAGVPYVYETSFTVPANTPDLIIDLQYAADNDVFFNLFGPSSILGVNGRTIAWMGHGQTATINYSTLHPDGHTVDQDRPFIMPDRNPVPAGVYTIRAYVYNFGPPGLTTFSPTGLLVCGTVSFARIAGPVGGITQLLADDSNSSAAPADGMGGSIPYPAFAGGLAVAAAAALIAGGWYVRRRRTR